MTEAVATELTHTVHFSRKLGDGDFGNTELGVFIQTNTEVGATAEQVADVLAAAIATAKVTVFEQLGIGYTVDDGGQVDEIPPAPKADPVSTVKKAFPGAQVVSSGDDYGRPSLKDKDALRAWALARFEAHPDEFFDNRAQKASGEVKSTFPDLKHKPTKTAVWLSDKA